MHAPRRRLRERVKLLLLHLVRADICGARGPAFHPVVGAARPERRLLYPQASLIRPMALCYHPVLDTYLRG